MAATSDYKRKPLDRLDRRILQELQKEGRISYVDLAERVSLSSTPCIERVKRLEKDGYIEGYYARLNPALMGYGMLVFVEISLSYQSPDAFQRFNQAVDTLPYLLECHLVSGDADYLIKARINDMSEYRALLGDMLLTLPGVKNSRSYIVMEEVKETAQLPVQLQQS
ncbi:MULTISPECIES: winged helix-turn-helix transcriptional regulator [unclassified Oceanobacter]|jgi:Lrp/AsnC family leucine-responsive transcriptional regulator|uniref:winged helix-turn-helix transcriptional regulator n=1 Tax=unclassified Oceanobacter TaxID=2620260 RepID=UPI0026E14933|nr:MULTISPECIES: winged helix-turn-helix transcriptional regulator [unclassified Oceanobacter]MDO6682701.1 Lrp/AsnC ligand binding domain-containing protein [Oceanobacter sp. 5_MG-2023]MDP2507180.1 Lrp/AsnC ligand binding domain-containing protein [Oceanobacter sp. 3_MG-2023]MDP2549151.1 Lrp/AsnC ligand binding domain-containing protein [Oceanobacter sp. 4_MG-2023]MDP2609060.1 Lrp/AsnC ligand binding domain-containing protein [Oceanobacter sp. 1_MG-2023]MDP2612382.1 Lrp/AsnC ligand binding dom